MSAVFAAAMNVSTGSYMGFTTATTVMNNANQMQQGWLQVELKEADMAAQIPGMVTIPPIIGHG